MTDYAVKRYNLALVLSPFEAFGADIDDFLHILKFSNGNNSKLLYYVNLLQKLLEKRLGRMLDI